MTCEVTLTKVSTVDTEQQWAKFSQGISCQSNYSSRVFFKTPPTLAAMKRADKITSLTSGNSTTNTTHSILTEGGTPQSFCGDPPNQARTGHLKAKAKARPKVKTKTRNQPQRQRAPLSTDNKDPTAQLTFQQHKTQSRIQIA